MSEEVTIVELTDEAGEIVRFEHLMTFEHESKKYVALLDAEDLQSEEVILLEAIEKDDEYEYLPIKSEVLLEEVFSVFMQLWDQED